MFEPPPISSKRIPSHLAHIPRGFLPHPYSPFDPLPKEIAANTIYTPLLFEIQ